MNHGIICGKNGQLVPLGQSTTKKIKNNRGTHVFLKDDQVNGILFSEPLSIPGACVGQGELDTPAGPNHLGVEPFLGCLVVDPEAYVHRQDSEESLRGRASISVSREDGGASRKVAAVGYYC